MILVTVGMQLGFDRLIEAMDEIAPSLDMPVIAQVGRGTFQPQNMEVRAQIAPREFEALIAQSRLIVSHAGIGTVLTAARYSKPVVLLPRRANLGEHRNDHQRATADQLRGRPGILIADGEADLLSKIEEGRDMKSAEHSVSAQVEQLNQAIAQFIETGTL